jgi:hypothetical protein
MESDCIGRRYLEGSDEEGVDRQLRSNDNNF